MYRRNSLQVLLVDPLVGPIDARVLRLPLARHLMSAIAAAGASIWLLLW